eukprot:30601-Prorocentrum_minimum.AAC.3
MDAFGLGSPPHANCFTYVRHGYCDLVDVAGVKSVDDEARFGARLAARHVLKHCLPSLANQYNLHPCLGFG